MSKQFVRSAKNVVRGYSSAQVMVRNATANESTGPNMDLLDELAEKTYDSVEFFEIMDMLDKRLNDKGKYWKHIAKSLTVLDYLVRFGSENCVLWCRENLYVIKTLREFRYEDETGVDQGQIIRVKAKELTALLNDEERLRQERSMNKRGGRRRKRADSRRSKSEDDLQRALEESRRTAEEEERRRNMINNNDDSVLQTALQLSKEEEELKRLQELQRLQDQQQQQQQQQYFDIFGNPISAEEYMQYQLQQQQQQALWAQQQREQELLAQQQQQQELLAHQQMLAEQQYWAQQQAALQQQQQQQAYYQQPLTTGSNNPFALHNNNLNQAKNDKPDALASLPDFGDYKPAQQQQQPVQQQQYQVPTQQVQQQPVQQQPLQQNRTGNVDISNKYSELNTLLASGTGLDTFGNTGQTRIPAQHTRTGTFINSQGTGYKQVGSDDPKNNPFLNSQYTGLPSSGIVPSHTGYGFGNQAQTQRHQQTQPPDQGVSLIDL